MEEAYNAGKLRSIGVSNFLVEDLENLMAWASVAPHVNQVLTHVGNTPSELIDYCAGKNILVEAYSPIAHGQILGSSDVITMAESTG